MLKLRDIMTREVLVLSPQNTLREAVDALAEHHVSGAPVLAGDAVVGVVTTSDIMEFQANTPALPAARDDEPVDPADDVVVPEWEGENAPPGTYYTELWADTGAEVAQRIAQDGRPVWDILEEHTVAEAMTRRVQALDPEASVHEAAALMARRGIHRVLVLDGKHLVGIVSTMDVTRAVADHRLVAKQFVFGPPRH